jgi:hypothetical protein
LQALPVVIKVLASSSDHVAALHAGMYPERNVTCETSLTGNKLALQNNLQTPAAHQYLYMITILEHGSIDAMA